MLLVYLRETQPGEPLETGLRETVWHGSLFQNVIILHLTEYVKIDKRTSTLVSAVMQIIIRLLNRNMQRDSIS